MLIFLFSCGLTNFSFLPLTKKNALKIKDASGMTSMNPTNIIPKKPRDDTSELTLIPMSAVRA